MCECRSYNRPDWGGLDPEVVVNYRAYFPNSKQETVSVDACIEGVMRDLWLAGVETMGCCCGHDVMPAPSVILGRPDQVELACSIISERDDRAWQVTVWSKTETQD